MHGRAFLFYNLCLGSAAKITRAGHGNIAAAARCAGWAGARWAHNRRHIAPWWWHHAHHWRRRTVAMRIHEAGRWPTITGTIIWLAIGWRHLCKGNARAKALCQKHGKKKDSFHEYLRFLHQALRFTRLWPDALSKNLALVYRKRKNTGQNHRSNHLRMHKTCSLIRLGLFR